MSKRFIAVAIGVAFAMSVTSAEAKHRIKRHQVRATYSHHHKRHQVARYAIHRVGRTHGASADRGCLVPAARALLARIESNFGPVQVISTCRPGAIIAGTSHPSLHRYGMAIDFRTSRKGEVVRWLAANNSGGTMTYSNSDHIHADVGHYHFVSLAGHRHVAHAGRRGQPDLSAGSGDDHLSYANGNADNGWPVAQAPEQVSGGRRYVRHARRHARHERTL